MQIGDAIAGAIVESIREWVSPMQVTWRLLHMSDQTMLVRRADAEVPIA